MIINSCANQPCCLRGPGRGELDSLCVHMCRGETPCTSRKHGVLWPKEGSSLMHHIQSQTKHLTCNAPCLAYNNPRIPGRLPISEELSLKGEEYYFSPVLMDVDDEEMNGPSCLEEEQLIGHVPSSSSKGPSMPEPKYSYFDHRTVLSGTVAQRNRTLKIVYIPDPTCYALKSKADSDIAWIRTVLSQKEIDMIKGVSSLKFHSMSIRKRSGKTKGFNVLIQEWVCIFDMP